MHRYPIYKRVGNPLQFAGFSGPFVIYVALYVFNALLIGLAAYFLGIDPLSILIGFFIAVFVALYVLWRLNKKHGVHGLGKLRARAKMPSYILSRGTVHRYIQPIDKLANKLIDKPIEYEESKKEK